MVDGFIKHIEEAITFVKGHKKYIKASESKRKLANLYIKYWLPYSTDFKSKFGKKTHSIIESNLSKIYSFTKKDFFEKKKVLQLLSNISPFLDEIKIDLIRKYGYVIEYNKKTEIVKKLQKINFKGTLEYLKNSEQDYNSGKWKPCCFNARLAMEEFLREFRENVTGKSVRGGTVGDHISVLEPILNIQLGDKLLIKNGLYGFLSNKGGHATTENPQLEDSKMSLTINYIFYDFFLEKFGGFLK